MNRIPWRGNFLPLLILSVIIFSGYETAPCLQASKSSVRINILSKHLESLRSERSELNFTLPPGTLVRTESNETYIRGLGINYMGGRYRITADGRALTSGRYMLHNGGGESLCSIIIEGTSRQYPLPLEIISRNNSLCIYITEKIEQYAIDSASAELGPLKPDEFEALYSLALAIHARCRSASARGRHRDSDFCDLTCCQTYRGRSGFQALTGPFLDTSDTGYGFFFHSSSGGRLFTESVFSGETRKAEPPADRLYCENLLLSRLNHSSWEARLERNETAKIIYPDGNTVLTGIKYLPELEIVIINTPGKAERASPENFRLMINRKRGWNFIKSNNYTLSCEGNEYIFRGSGLGHCTGMSMEGAIQLASKGYSRYEILEHYYPGVEYVSAGNKGHSSQYIIYNTSSGGVIRSSSGPAFLERRIPCGSVFKLFTVIYLAQKRRDIFFNHKFTCGREHRSPLPLHCWDTKGHGEMNLESAISNSCNLWFTSLHDKIDRKDFYQWFRTFTSERSISMRLPETATEKEWCELLAGLNFKADISIRDIINLSMYIERYINHEAENGGEIPAECAELISAALCNTFITGTAKTNTKEIEPGPSLLSLPHGLWGKTGTMIAGTNSHFSYGLFTGGSGETGVIVLLRKGKGADAAHLAVKLLKERLNVRLK